MRIVDGVQRPAPVAIVVDGADLNAYPGESLAVALLAADHRRFRWTAGGAARGPFCNMGVCFDCVVEVNGVRRRACMTSVREGMVVSTTSERP